MLIHIGLSRAGSTYLQNVIFPNFKKCKYINLFKHDKLRLNFFYNYNFLLKKKFKQKFDILSCENFLNPYTNINLLVSRLKYFEPTKKNKKIEILLILRNPFEHLLSLYNYSVINGNIYEKLDDVFDFKYMPFASNMNKKKAFTMSFYDYLSLEKNLKQHFKVHIFWHEDIFKNEKNIILFQKKLSKLISKKFQILQNKHFNKKNRNRNPSSTYENIKKKRILNFRREKNNSHLDKEYFSKRYSNKFKNKFITLFNKINDNRYKKIFK